jgi:hypothetical protein
MINLNQMINHNLFGITEEEYIKRYWELENNNDKGKQDKLVIEIIKAEKKRELAVSLLFFPLMILIKIYLESK